MFVIELNVLLPGLAATEIAGLQADGREVRVSARTSIVLPHPSYYLTLTGGLVVSLAILAAFLPILGRITATQNARFE